MVKGRALQGMLGALIALVGTAIILLVTAPTVGANCEVSNPVGYFSHAPPIDSEATPWWKHYHVREVVVVRVADRIQDGGFPSAYVFELERRVAGTARVSRGFTFDAIGDCGRLDVQIGERLLLAIPEEWPLYPSPSFHSTGIWRLLGNRASSLGPETLDGTPFPHSLTDIALLFRNRLGLPDTATNHAVVQRFEETFQPILPDVGAFLFGAAVGAVLWSWRRRSVS